MTPSPVQAVWVWRFTKAPYKATYGRLRGTTYSKDFLQVIGECAEVLDRSLERSTGEVVNLRFEWPGGSRHGTLFEAADYDVNGRLDLRWQTNNCPDPWRLFRDDDPNPLKTFPGNPDYRAAEDADREFALFQSRQLDPWLLIAKLYVETDVLHVRAYLGNPPDELEYTSISNLPEPVLAAMRRVPERGGCAVVTVHLSAEDSFARQQILFDPSRIHDAWSVEEIEDVALLELIKTQRARAPVEQESERRPFGGSYRRANTNPKTSVAQVFTRDPDEVDRGLRAHNVTQEMLADLVKAHDLEPSSSIDTAYDYDLAWERAGMIYVVEVKSLTNQNERLQLRLGLGQVLEYAHRLQTEGWSVQPVLAVEREATDAMWVEICEGHGVRLVWPANMESLF